MPLKNRAHAVGSLDERIGIYNATDTENADYSSTETFTLTKTVWANIAYRSRRQLERIMSGKETALQQVSFFIRKPEGFSVTTKSQVQYDGETYDIITIMKDVGRRQYWELITELKT